MITRSATTLIFTIARAANPDEPLSPEFIASLDAVTAVLTYVLAALGVIVMTGMSERVKAIKDGIPEAQLPPAKGLAACVSNIGYFKYVLAEANKMESTMKISDSWTEAAAQTDERNECGRKVVNVTEHNTEDACCDTSDLVEPSSAATANGLLTSEIPKAPQTATCDGNGQSEEEREEERDVGPSLVDLQMDERLAGWSAPAQGAGISPRAARAELSAGAGGVEMQQQIKGLGLAGDLVFGKR